MSSPADLYAQKLTTPETAVAAIPPGVNIAMGMALGEPPALVSALAERVAANGVRDLNLWYFHSMPHAGETILRHELLDRVRPHCMFLGPTERELLRKGAAEGKRLIEFVPVAFSEACDLLSRQIELDTFLTTVSPMDRHGFFTFGTNNDYASTAARAARRVIVEVNPNMPRVFGDSQLHVSEVDAVIEHDVPLIDVPQRPLEDEDRTIGTLIADLVPDGACLQMGIGSLPNAVCAALTDRRDLGIHTELFTPGLADLIRAGAVTNRRKTTFPGRTVFTFALGDRALYDMLDDNPSMTSLPVNIVNDPRHVAKNARVHSVNATLQVDLSGACNSEHLMGHQFSGAGGQLDFVRGARASKGGRSIIACHSTAKDSTVSRIVCGLEGPVTVPRNDIDTIVTEHGVAHLEGLTTSQRARALIALAHPKFRDDLTRAARKDGLI